MSLNSIAQTVMPLVTSTPAIETAWLSALARMESVAARQIRSNVSAFSPRDQLEAIEAHAADEDRHAQLILAMRPLGDDLDERHRGLQTRLCRIAESFVVGYFGNPLLITAKNKHAAYAHGAVTIEQFPFQVYVAYLKATRLEAVRNGLPNVIRDEQAHLALGRRLVEQLPENERLSIERLGAIEEDMCCRMLARMSRVVSRFIADSDGNANSGEDATVSPPESRDFEALVSATSEATLAWAFVLARAEESAAQHMCRIFTSRGLPLPEPMHAHLADELRHAKTILRAIVLERRRQQRSLRDFENAAWRAMRRYQLTLFSGLMKLTEDPNTLYHLGALALETRVLKHYKDLATATDHIGLSHVLASILIEEAEHTRHASQALRENGVPGDLIRHALALEQRLFTEMCDAVASRLRAFKVAAENGASA